MLNLLTQFTPFFVLVLLGWGATRARLLPLEGIGALTVFVLFFGLPAMLFRLGASGALHQPGLGWLLLSYGVGGVCLMAAGLWWAQGQGLSRRDGGLVALVIAFPNTGFLGLPLLTGLLGPQAAGPVAATLIIDVLLLSSLCLAWAHSRPGTGSGPDEAAARVNDSAWHAAQASLKGALRNPLLWSMALGMAWAETAQPVPAVLDTTLKLLGQSATPAALFTLGAILARAQMQPVATHRVVAPKALVVPTLLKLVLHPLLVLGAGRALQHQGLNLPDAGLLALVMAAALPSASNVSMLAERERADVALVARIILGSTALALVGVTAWALGLGLGPERAAAG
ncbi:AEC family transporter [Aquabacterium lacunae]|uniref:AEC family transporter n=1 Tax=Aquabacterium lacunae TaxID=2528630 RepID=A0A4V2JFN4_9BURK|nr:AEC family transporter [Aquabacterium lacunae]TBO31238.1 AEC family transporter [Aquabacterium lacunae]